MNLRLKRTPGLFLAGFMGSGKTTVGRIVAHELGWHFVDLDDRIEYRSGRAIRDIFDYEGEERFRDLESEALAVEVGAIRRGRPTVVALGGGAVIRKENVELMRSNGVVVWLDCALDVIRARVHGSPHRPLARDPQKFERLYHERRPMYEQADYRIEIAVDDSRRAAQDVLALEIF